MINVTKIAFKSILTTLLLLISIQLVCSQSTKLDLYLLIGQSNMAGRGQLDSLKNVEVNNQIWMINAKNEWVPAKHPIHFDKPTAVGVGLALSFAEKVQDSSPTSSIGLIPCAVGGSGIDDWKTGVQHHQTGIYAYDEMLIRAKKAKQSGRLKAILWHQGENDCTPEKITQYEEKLIAFFKQLRKDLKAKNTPILVATLGDFYVKKNPIAAEINVIIGNLPTKVKNLQVISSTDLTHKGDHTHFSTKALEILGERYAESYLQLK